MSQEEDFEYTDAHEEEGAGGEEYEEGEEEELDWQLRPPENFLELKAYAPDTWEVDDDSGGGQTYFIIGQNFWDLCTKEGVVKKQTAAGGGAAGGRGDEGDGGNEGTAGGGTRSKAKAWAFETLDFTSCDIFLQASTFSVMR